MTFRPWLALCAAVVALNPGDVRAAKAPDTPAGLVATFSDGKQSITAVVPSPNFVLKESESIHPQLGPAFTAEWNGAIRIVKKAKYTITLDGAADAKLTIDNREIANQPTELDAGDHALRIKLERKAGSARLQLIWQADFFLTEPVSPSSLIHAETPVAVEQGNVVERGRALVEELNCVACHQSSSKLLGSRGAPDLSHIGGRARAEWMYAWLADPKHFRSIAAMPAVALTDNDRRDAAAYLATLKDSKSRIKEQQPETSRAHAGKTLYESIGCTACHGQTSVALDGLGSKYSIAHLAAYLEDPLKFDPSGRMPGMLLTKDEASALAQYLVVSKNKDFETPLPGGADVKHGQQVVQSAGCINCHRLQTEDGKLLQPAAAAALQKLEQVDPARGCLADAPFGKAMKYGLTADQRQAIAAFISSAKAHPLMSTAPSHDLAVTAAKFRCTACHELDGSKPADETDRIPPLTGAGSRLRPEWIQTVLTQKQRSRIWFRKRMPEFGGKNMEWVVEQIVAAGGAGPVDTLPVPSKEEAIAGAKIVGTAAGGLGCITCHGFAGSKPAVADDTRGPDLTTAAGRLRADHFRRWVYDPKRVMPATPMPAFFADLPHQEAADRIETIWKYVALGSEMPPPPGWIDKTNYRIYVTDEPVVMRTNLPGVNGGNIPRGIAVGLPGGVNYVFDADKCQLAYAWTGGFLDMQPSWSGRGGQVVKVLGKRFYEATALPVRIGETKLEPRVQFKGYRLDSKNGMPTFLYLVDGVAMEESIIYVPEERALVRRTRAGLAAQVQTIPLKESK